MEEKQTEKNADKREQNHLKGDGISEEKKRVSDDSTAMEGELISSRISLIEQMVTRENMLKAYKRVVSNKGVAGVDGVTVRELYQYCEIHWERTREELLNGSFRPQPVLKVEIPKAGGGVRMLGIPTVMDRLIQQAILQVLNPIFDKDFSESSYGFRLGRSAHQALKKAVEYLGSGKQWVVDMDLTKFFDRVNHDIVMSRVSRKIRDKRMLRLIGSFLRAEISHEGKVFSRREGMPQGGPLSPLLANIVLDDLDKELERRGHLFCRYADDCNIYVSSRKAGERVMASVERFVQRCLKLSLNKEKSRVARPWDREFLGYSVIHHAKPKLKVSDASLRKIKQKLKWLFRRGRGKQIDKVIAEANRLLTGWFQYFKLNILSTILLRLDKWIRRRLRCIQWRQWKNRRTRFKELMKRGLSRERAIMGAFNTRGPWANSGKAHMQFALPRQYFEQKGLVSLFDLQKKRCSL